jgi:hemolysin III
MYYGERLNSITHLIGAALAAIGTASLLVVAAELDDPWKIVAFSIYGAMLITTYATSVVYHSTRGRAKRIWCKCDHCAVYLLIAGSYTPFALVSLRGPWGWSLLGTVWGLALLGLAQEVWLARGKRILSLLIYLAMGWLAAVAVRPLIRALTWPGFLWLAAGGVLYSFGIIFYATDEKLRHGHGIWHLFVLGGSACHYVAVWSYVA